MFKREAGTVAGGETVIAQGVKVDGEFTSNGNVIIEGEVTGAVAVAGDLTVGQGARIHADVTAQNAAVAGEIGGNLRVNERLEISESARVLGDIEAQILSVSPGASINGRVTMGEQGGKRTGGKTAVVGADIVE